MHFSCESVESETPKALFDALPGLFGGFDLDPCATAQNAKCERFLSREDDGLTQCWSGKVFMNPPYGRQIGKWVRKAFESGREGALVVCLLPARTDAAWWQDYAVRGYVRFLRGRFRFGEGKSAAPFPSALVIYGRFFGM